MAVGAAGIAAMYLPSYWASAHGLWQSDDFGHAPIICSSPCGCFWQVREAVRLAPYRPKYAAGWTLLMLGLLSYSFGRFLELPNFVFL